MACQARQIHSETALRLDIAYDITRIERGLQGV